MRAEWTEGQLEFNFSSALQTCQPDKNPGPLATVAPPLKSVDFYVWLTGQLWLIEVKDPEAARDNMVEIAKKTLYSELKNDALLKEHILPKLFGSYVHLAFEDVDLDVPVRYGVVLGVRGLSNADRNTLTDKIERIVRKIGPKVGPSNHWPEIEVHNLESWNKAHPEMKVSRVNFEG